MSLTGVVSFHGVFLILLTLKISMEQPKLRGEEAIKASKCTYAILRTSWVVSAHGSNFVKTMLRLSETRTRLAVVDDQIVVPLARDIAKTCISIAKSLILDTKKTGVYHYSGLPDVSWCQFANTIFEKAGRKTIAQPILTAEYCFCAASIQQPS